MTQTKTTQFSTTENRALSSFSFQWAYSLNALLPVCTACTNATPNLSDQSLYRAHPEHPG